MRLSILAALAAATALVPVAAGAQNHGRDRGSWRQNGTGDHSRGDRVDRQARPAAPARASRPAEPTFTAPAHVNHPNMAQGFRDRDAGRPAQVRADADWRAHAGGSHASDRPDRNDWNRDRAGQWRQGDDRGHSWTRDRGDHDGAWNRDRNDRDRAWNRGGDNRGHDWNRDGNDRDHDWNRDRGDHGHDWNRGDHDRDRAWNRDRRDNGRFDHDWRRDNRYDWHDYRVRHRNVFHLPRYYAPYGWDYGYRRFGIGFRLDSILFGSNYWISDPYYYRLPPAYGPYRWVRYYNDALLVDIETGEVVDVVYGIFW